MTNENTVMTDSVKKPKKPIRIPAFLTKFFKKFSDENTFLGKYKFVLLAFLLPFLFMFVAFAIKGVSPFGSNQILVTDLWHQYYPFLVDFQYKLHTGGSLLWTWKTGAGTNFIALMSYYLCSPLNFLSVFIPSSWLREFLYVITCVKIGCAGAFFAIFLRTTFKRNDISIAIFGMMYALCSFIMGYYWCVIWLDTIALLPLVICGEIALMKHGKFKLFTISLGLAIITNYYIGLFVCIFVVLVAIGYTIVHWTTFKTFLKNVGKITGFSLIGGAMSAIITLPTYYALGRAHSAASTFPSKFAINIGDSNDFAGVIQGFMKTISNSIAFVEPTTKEGLPNVYSGVIAIILGLLFLTCGKISKRERIFCGILEVFFIYSFIDRRLDYMWHGFHFPNMLPYRFSFLYSFVLIYMAFRVFQNIKEIRLFQILLTIGMFLIVMGISYNYDETLSLIATAFIGLLTIIWLILYTLKIVPKKALALALTIIAIAEGACTAYIGVKTVTVTSGSNYPLSYKDVMACLDTIHKNEKDQSLDLYHEELTKYHALDDVAMYNMNGISMFNSITTESVSKYMEKFGICSWPGSNRYTYQDSSPYTDLLLNIKYIIATNSNYLDTAHQSLVTENGSVKALEAKYYVPQGFVVNEELLDLNMDIASDNPFNNQNSIYQLSTGETDNMYEALEVVSQGHTDYKQFNVNKNEYGNYSFKKQEGCEDSPHLKYNYTAPRDGSAYIYFKASGCDNCTIKINDTDVTSYYCKRPWIMTVGDVKEGDKISVYASVDKDTSSGTVNVYCNMLNEEAFQKAYEYYNEQHLNMTNLRDDLVTGNIEVKRAGLFYTSIAYDPGWKIYIDGQETEMSTVNNGLVAFKISEGNHFIKMKYVPEGFKTGTIITIGSILLLILISIAVRLYRKKKKTVIAVSPQGSVTEEFDIIPDNDEDIIEDDLEVTDITDPDLTDLSFTEIEDDHQSDSKEDILKENKDAENLNKSSQNETNV